MKYGLGIRLIISFLFGALAVLYKLNFNHLTQSSVSELSAVFPIPRKFLFDTITSPENVPKFFSWVSKFDSPGKRGLGPGRMYKGVVNMPFLGMHEFRWRVAEAKDGNWITLRPDPNEFSYLNPEITVVFSSVHVAETHFHLKITYRRDSALFRYTLGAFLKSITDEQMERVKPALRKFVTRKWDEFRYPEKYNLKAVKKDTAPKKATGKSKSIKKPKIEIDSKDDANVSLPEIKDEKLSPVSNNSPNSDNRDLDLEQQSLPLPKPKSVKKKSSKGKADKKKGKKKKMDPFRIPKDEL